MHLKRFFLWIWIMSSGLMWCTLVTMMVPYNTYTMLNDLIDFIAWAQYTLIWISKCPCGTYWDTPPSCKQKNCVGCKLEMWSTLNSKCGCLELVKCVVHTIWSNSCTNESELERRTPSPLPTWRQGCSSNPPPSPVSPNINGWSYARVVFLWYTYENLMFKIFKPKVCMLKSNTRPWKNILYHNCAFEGLQVYDCDR